MALVLNGTDGSVSTPAMQGSTAGVSTGMYFPAANQVALATNGTLALIVDSSQNVGIGTASPGVKLDVNGALRVGLASNPTTIASNSQLYDQSGVGPTISGYNFTVRTGNPTPAETFRINSSGNVGIGTASPNRKLVVYDADTPFLALQNSTTGTANIDGFQLIQDTLAGYVYQYENMPIIFGTNATERMRINAVGDVLVRCTSSPSASVNGFGIGTFAVMGNDTAFVCSSGAYTGGDYQIGFVNGNGLIGNIFTSNSSTSYNTSSDYRLKENIAPMQNALNVVQQLKPVTYSWKSDGSSSQGFIAHELQKVMPDCVTGEKDAVDAEGKPVYQGIDTSFLVATLTAAIQEQQALITTLTDRITALEAK
jgi:hypothetical protein